jgi:hypothetical protein
MHFQEVSFESFAKSLNIEMEGFHHFTLSTSSLFIYLASSFEDSVLVFISFAIHAVG